MKLPSRDIGPWARELIQQCESSREDRIANLQRFYSYYYNGADGSGGAKCRYNKIFSHIDRLTSFLFSAEDVRFTIGFDQTVGEPWLERAIAQSRILTRHFQRHACDLEFADAVHWSLIEGKTLVKQQWGHHGLEPWLVHPHFFAVLREDIDGLDRQEAFVHTVFVTKSEFQRIVSEHRDRKEIEEEVAATAQQREDELSPMDNSLRQVVIGGLRPVQVQVGSPGKGNVLVSNQPSPQMDTKVAADLVRIDELWVINSEQDDYTTIRLVDDIVIDGRYQHQNLSGIRGEQPFTEVCPNRNPGYFWGESEITQLIPMQDMLNDSMEDLRRALKKRARPSRLGIGFSGLTQEQYRAADVPDGFFSQDQPTAKIETLKPDEPTELVAEIQRIIERMDEMGGFAPITTGQGEPGVRSGNHAQTLLRTASPRIRDRALLVERQCGAFGDFSFKMLQAKEATVFKSKSGEEFLMSQCGSDYSVAVDSHSGSPIFSDDTERKAFQLQRANAISPAELIAMVRPPNTESLIASAEKREAVQAALVQQHPELLTKGGKRK